MSSNASTIIDGFKHWIQNEENGVCFIPEDLCRKVLKLLNKLNEQKPKQIDGEKLLGKIDEEISEADKMMEDCAYGDDNIGYNHFYRLKYDYQYIRRIVVRMMEEE